MRNFLLIFSFLMFVLGLLSIFLKTSGLQFVFFKSLEQALGNGAYLLYICMTLLGLALFYLIRVPTKIPEDIKENKV